MEIKISKTKTMHVRAQLPVSKTTATQAKAACKHKCPFPNGNFSFMTWRGLQCHKGKCKWRDEHPIDKILDFEGPPTARRYKIRWDCFPPEESWVPRGNLHHEVIKEFEVANGIYDHTQAFRCEICDLPCKNKTGVKIHAAKAHGKVTKHNDGELVQNFDDTLADKTVKSKKLSK